jgi:hypothetical protein
MINEKSLHFLRVAASKAIVIISTLAVVAICMNMIYASPDLQVIVIIIIMIKYIYKY